MIGSRAQQDSDRHRPDGHLISSAAEQPPLGLSANLAQFSLLIAVNALIGGTLGQERTVLPLLAERTFHLIGYTFC